MLAQRIKSNFISLVLGVFSIFMTTSVSAAENIAFNFAPFGQFKIKVKDLEAFIAEGEISDELAFYFNRLPPQQLERLPELLTTPLEFDPLAVSKFSNSSIGEAVIKNFGKGIRVNFERNGFYALRGAMIAAAFDEERLTLINLLRQFPLETIHLDLNVLTQYLKRGITLSVNQKTIDQTWFADTPAISALKTNQSETLGGSHVPTRVAFPPTKPQFNLKRLGRYSWKQTTITYTNPRRVQPGSFDLYQPEGKQAAPLVVISHGLASNRQTFAYLGRHLSSHGFAVAVIEHDDISLEKFDRFLAGNTSFPEPNNLIDQPLDVSAVLDRLEQEPNLNLQQVGVIGQSFGGYTSLALAGGELIADVVPNACRSEDHQQVLLDLSSLAKCTFYQLNQSRLQLKDPRIKAAIAINPMGKIFGQEGMSRIDVPTMIISGTNDLIMPPVAEQITPFSWLDANLDKYLILVKPGTHFSFLQEGLGVLPVPDIAVGPSPSSAHPTLKAISTAFFQVHLNQKAAYQSYLELGYVNQLNNDNHAFEWSIIRDLETSQLQEILDNEQ